MIQENGTRTNVKQDGFMSTEKDGIDLVLSGLLLVLTA